MKDPVNSPSPAVAPSTAKPLPVRPPTVTLPAVAVPPAARPPLPVARRIAFGRCAPVEHLPSVVECGKLTVPLDYAHPDGKKIDLTVSRLRSKGTAAERQGALVYNPGGPGASSMKFPMYSAIGTFRKLLDAYDFVGYAPRGVDRSAPLSCQKPAEFAKAPTDSPRVPSERYKRQRTLQAAAYARGCARNAGRSLRHFTSLNNARDLDMLRAGLGEKKLTFMGASYGTYFGALYATLFPGHVRRMVFDSVVNPDPRQIWYRSNLDQNIGFERRWRDWRRWVAKHDKTYHLGTTEQAVHRSYETARDRLRGKPAGGKVGPGQLQAAFLKTGYNDGYWARRAQALSAYLKGDPKPLIAQAAPKPESAKEDENGNAVYTAVECNDAPWPRDLRKWDADNTRVARVAPFETWDNAWMNLPCAFWPHNSGGPRGDHSSPLDVRVAPGALPPVLLLAAEHDPATPYSGALELQRRLPGSSLVTERGAGTHGVAFGPNECANEHAETYLLTGKTPGPRAYCAPRPEPVADTSA
ncbi:alpha/beta fold hydrolase [Streptomyces sp. MST-110588]|nr:alpha/beta fold hydrolase [Streptomyces sp. MST-110588]